MTERDIIVIQNTRVFMPSEYIKLRKAMVDENKALVDDYRQQLAEYATPEKYKELQSKINRLMKYPLMCDFLLHTGMRLVEAKDIKPDMYRASRRVIAGVSCAKVKCKASQRTVMLSMPGCDAVEAWLASGLEIPVQTTKDGKTRAGSTTIGLTLKRYADVSGIGSDYVTGKSFRKTLASLLMACYPEREMYIAASMGHDRTTLQKHYLGLGFPRAEIDLAREMLKGWGAAV